MTHDFAKKPRPKSNSKPPAPPARRVPGWVWLFTGIVTGVFISFLAYLSDIVPARNEHSSASTSTKAAPAAKAGTAVKGGADSDKPRFDFYTLLPEREVIVDNSDDDASAAAAGAVEKTEYILQAGSFRSGEDADRLRARMLLMGLDAYVEQVNSKDNSLWHRVMVGPFQSRSKLSKARSLLAEEGILRTLVLKRKVEH